MNADGSNVRRLTTEPGYDGGPFFTPDGQHIVWRHFEENGLIANVWTMKLDGSDKRQVTDFKSMSWAPYFHPSGDYLIFTSNKLGFENFELFVADAKGEREPVRVSFTDGFDGLPVFSPDGKKLAWTSGRTSDGKAQIFLADWDDAAARQAIAESPARVASSVSSPNESFSPAITKSDLEHEVEWLADAKRDGRMTGTTGAQISAQWLADYFRRIGLQPLGKDFLFPFEFNSGERVLPEKQSSRSRPSEDRQRARRLMPIFVPFRLVITGTWKGRLFSPVTVSPFRKAAARVTTLTMALM